MNILLLGVFPAIAEALRARGHQVEAPSLPAGVLYLPGLPLLGSFRPDLIIQQEELGPRLFLDGLAAMPCPTLFWAVDTHLNLHWQRWYALLFDAVLSPHPGRFASLPAPGRPDVTGCAFFASPRPWRPHALRRRDLAFCGVIDEHRPIRRNLAALLKPLGLGPVCGLSHAALLDHYADARLVPNESIAGEVNFRLMEAASCGCLSLNPPIGPDQDSLFAPGREMLVYHDGLELLEHIAWARTQPEAAERMGRAALARALREHLPRHRAELMETVGLSPPGRRLEGALADLAFWLTLARQIRAGRLHIDGAAHARQGLELLARAGRHTAPVRHGGAGGGEAGDEGAGAFLPGRLLAAHAQAEILCLLAEQPDGAAAALRHCQRLLAAAAATGATDATGAAGATGAAAETAGHGSSLGSSPGSSPGDSLTASPASSRESSRARSLIVAATASAVALREGNFPLARSFWALYAGKRGPAPREPQTLYRHWAALLEEAGLASSPGFPFAPERGMIPGNALEFLFSARVLDPRNDETHRQCERLLERDPGWLSLSLGYLAESSMYDQKNWRKQTAFGLASLRALRVREGLEELALARDLAGAAGRERLFEGLLRAQAPDGRILRALAGTKA